MQFLITTPHNPEAETTIFGIRLSEGKGLLNEHTLPAAQKRSATEIATAILTDFAGGYALEPLDEAAKGWMEEYLRGRSKVRSPKSEVESEVGSRKSEVQSPKSPVAAVVRPPTKRKAPRRPSARSGAAA